MKYSSDIAFSVMTFCIFHECVIFVNCYWYIILYIVLPIITQFLCTRLLWKNSPNNCLKRLRKDTSVFCVWHASPHPYRGSVTELFDLTSNHSQDSNDKGHLKRSQQWSSVRNVFNSVPLIVHQNTTSFVIKTILKHNIVYYIEYMFIHIVLNEQVYKMYATVRNL